MKRRDVLKGLGMSIGGYAVATPTLLTLLQSCKTEVAAWAPVFFSAEEGVVVRNLVDLILPKTEATPGALDVNVPEFLDLYMEKGYKKEVQEETKEGLKAILTALNVTEENPASNIKTEEYDALLAKYLRTKQEEHDVFREDKTDKAIFETLWGIRDKVVWAYRTSEEIGENVLAYDPIPGAQLGCIPLEEATRGKRWSL